MVPPDLQQALQNLTDRTSFFTAELDLDSNWDINGGEDFHCVTLCICAFFICCVYTVSIGYYCHCKGSGSGLGWAGLGQVKGSGVRVSVCQ